MAAAAALKTILGRAPGLLAVLVTDKDGVLIAQSAVDEFDPATVPASLLASASTVLEQASKLDTGNSVATVAEHENVKVVHFEGSSAVIHLIAAKDASTGLLLEMRQEVLQRLRPLLSSVPQS